MFFSDYFIDRAKKCLTLAKRIRDPRLAKTLADRAQILTRTAIEAERALALGSNRKPEATQRPFEGKNAERVEARPVKCFGENEPAS